MMIADKTGINDPDQHLINLEIGDVIPLDQDASGEINLSIEGVDKLRCLIGTHKGSKAVQILDKIKKGK